MKANFVNFNLEHIIFCSMPNIGTTYKWFYGEREIFSLVYGKEIIHFYWNWSVKVGSLAELAALAAA